MFKPNKYIPLIPDYLWVALVASAVYAICGLGWLTGAQNSLTELRAEYSSRAASGDIVFVGIDKQSIDNFGVWPWPRSIHADLIDRLIELDVAEIGVDIDFSARSNPENDERLATSLEKAAGAVILPVFVQDHSADKSDNKLKANTPIEIFKQHSWLASVNVMTDYDGVVRNFPMGSTIEGEFISSMPATLSGVFDYWSDQVAINFAIDPNTIPAYSVSDILSGEVTSAELADKTVLIGAQAVELRDNFVTPVHGSLPGAMVQILAAETLLQDVGLAYISFEYALLLTAFLVAALFLLVRYATPWRGMKPKLVILLSLSISLELAGLYFYRSSAFILPTAGLQLFIFSFLALRATLEMDLRHWLLVFANIKSQNTENVMSQIVKDNANGIMVVDEAGTLLNFNERAISYFALPEETKAQTSVLSCLPRKVEEDVKKAIIELKVRDKSASLMGDIQLENGLHEGGTSFLEYTITASRLANVHKDQETEEYIASITVRDITIRLRQEQKLLEYAKYDELTGALRRNEFIAVIMDKFAEEDDNNCTIFAVNLHRFKTINVTLGRETGDDFLKAAFIRLSSLPEDISDVARLGGDTFAFMVSGKKSEAEIELIAQKVIEAMNAPFLIGKATLTVGLHVGAAASESLQYTSAQQLVENAETALDEACKTSGNGFVMYEETFTAVLDYARSVEANLWNALDKNEIQVHYQPQVDLQNNCELCGLEALVRWNHPELGFVSPQDFIEIAEANGFIDKLGYWVLSKACEDALFLPDHVSVAVNVAPVQFKRSDIAQMVEEVLEKTGLPAHRLHIEITEAGFLDATDDVVATLERLRAMGICLALDDFGTGFSSLGYFAQFPINKIKVDQMFVRTLERGSNNEAIIRSVKTLANGLNLKMICEGVETAEQLELLREIGSHEGQGYYFGKPQPIQSIMANFIYTKNSSEQVAS